MTRLKSLKLIFVNDNIYHYCYMEAFRYVSNDWLRENWTPSCGILNTFLWIKKDLAADWDSWFSKRSLNEFIVLSLIINSLGAYLLITFYKAYIKGITRRYMLMVNINKCNLISLKVKGGVWISLFS